MEIKLKKFDITSLRPNKNIYIIGRKQCGKSILIKELLNQNTEIKSRYIFSSTCTVSNIYENLKIKPIFIEQNFNSIILKNIINYHHNKINAKCDNSKGIIVMDDMVHNKNIIRDCEFRKLLLNSRHYHLSTIISMQYDLLPVFLKDQADYIFIFNDSNINNLKKLWKNYFPMIEKFEHFKTIINSLNKYECLVIIRFTSGGCYDDNIYWFSVDKNKNKPNIEELLSQLPLCRL
jgi:hypothetical protein